MKDADLIPVLLLTLFGIAVAIGIALGSFVRRWRRTRHRLRSWNETSIPLLSDPIPQRTAFFQRPASWLAIRSRNLEAVQAGLSLHNPKPCRWFEGFAEGNQLFIAPPVDGWILVLGSALPDPDADIDVCYRFLADLSRKVGQVQFFHADSMLGHHAWVRAEGGTIRRAYAWADQTLWNQGIKTGAEIELGLKCFSYFEMPDAEFGETDFPSQNVEKVPLLAARWSLDPFSIDERAFQHALGIAGEL